MPSIKKEQKKMKQFWKLF